MTWRRWKHAAARSLQRNICASTCIIHASLLCVAEDTYVQRSALVIAAVPLVEWTSSQQSVSQTDRSWGSVLIPACQTRAFCLTTLLYTDLDWRIMWKYASSSHPDISLYRRSRSQFCCTLYNDNGLEFIISNSKISLLLWTDVSEFYIRKVKHLCSSVFSRHLSQIKHW